MLLVKDILLAVFASFQTAFRTAQDDPEANQTAMDIEPTPRTPSATLSAQLLKLLQQLKNFYNLEMIKVIRDSPKIAEEPFF